LDKTVGHNSLVREEHKEKLPFCEATLLEIQRLGPVAPSAAARCCTKDTLVDGTLIKEGYI